MATAEKDAAPHGRDENGVPNAPFGKNLDGTPRKSNRGARAGQKGNATPVKRTVSKTDRDRRDAVITMVNTMVVMPLAAASIAPPVVARIGQTQADALAGDAYLLNQYTPAIADGLIVLGQSKPGILRWLDQAEEKAPYLALTMAVVQLAQAVVINHRNPNPAMAQAAREAVLGAVQEAQEAQNATYDPDGQPVDSEGAEATSEAVSEFV